MKNYLICNTQDIVDINGNVLGKRVCDVADSTFPVSDDYEWKQHAETFDVYAGAWYWADKPTQYVAPYIPQSASTKEEMLAQLQALQTQIQTLE